MNRFILVSVVCMQFCWINGAPSPDGVGAYAYQDSNGNSVALETRNARCEKGCEVRPSNIFRSSTHPPFFTQRPPRFPSLGTSRLSRSSFGIRPLRFQPFRRSLFAPFNGGFGNFGMPNFGSDNSAFASGVATPGMSHQIAAINPANPNQPNINVVNRFAETGPGNGGNYMSVSSSSYATSSNVDGVEKRHRGAETTVNNNGVVNRYSVQN